MKNSKSLSHIEIGFGSRNEKKDIEAPFWSKTIWHESIQVSIRTIIDFIRGYNQRHRGNFLWRFQNVSPANYRVYPFGASKIPSDHDLKMY